ncbi:MAG: response regulator [Gemmatimonadota bacterium]
MQVSRGVRDREKPTSESTQRRAIVVEDDPGVRDILTLLFELRHWQILKAGDGKAGLELARNVAPDLIVTDLDMPGISGIELAQELHAGGMNDIPIIAITSASSDLRTAAQESGLFRAVMRKPFTVDEIMKVVDQAVQPDGRPG